MEKEEVIANLKKGGGGGVGVALKVLPQFLMWAFMILFMLRFILKIKVKNITVSSFLSHIVERVQFPLEEPSIICKSSNCPYISINTNDCD